MLVPNDVSNEARALLLLEAQGLIKLKEGVGLEVTRNDIVENPKNLEIVEMEAAQLPVPFRMRILLSSTATTQLKQGLR